jgi:hypothetical protein
LLAAAVAEGEAAGDLVAEEPVEVTAVAVLVADMAGVSEVV